MRKITKLLLEKVKDKLYELLKDYDEGVFERHNLKCYKANEYCYDNDIDYGYFWTYRKRTCRTRTTCLTIEMSVYADNLSMWSIFYIFKNNGKMEKDQLLKELYDYLDGYDYVDKSEVNCAVQEFFMEQNGYFEPSYSELLIIGTLADEYIKERNLFV